MVGRAQHGNFRDQLIFHTLSYRFHVSILEVEKKQKNNRLTVLMYLCVFTHTRHCVYANYFPK